MPSLKPDGAHLWFDGGREDRDDLRVEAFDQMAAAVLSLCIAVSYGFAALFALLAGEAKLIGVGFSFAAARDEKPLGYWLIFLANCGIALLSLLAAVRFLGWLS